jgi:hypothetical protein
LSQGVHREEQRSRHRQPTHVRTERSPQRQAGSPIVERRLFSSMKLLPRSVVFSAVTGGTYNKGLQPENW